MSAQAPSPAPVSLLGGSPVTLSLTTLLALMEAAAERGAERALAAKGAPAKPSRVLDAAALAAELGVSRQTVYGHAAELGGWRLHDGPRAPWRFDLELAKERMARCVSERSLPDPARVDGLSDLGRAPRAARLPHRLPATAPILRSRPRMAA